MTARRVLPWLLGLSMSISISFAQDERPAGVKFLAPRAEPTEQKQWALLVGVNGYEAAGNLKYPGRDMQALGDCLREAGFPEERVTALVDGAPEPGRKPTAANIRRELEALIGRYDTRTGQSIRPGKVGEGDLVVLAFSGHGVHIDGKSFLCPADAKPEDPASLISVDEIYGQLNFVPARQKLLIVDACRNDPTRKKGARAGGFDGAKQLVRSLEQPPLGILVLSSCTMGQYSFEDDQLHHGVFTYYLVDGLKGAADDDGDGRVTLLDLYRYAGRQTEQRVARLFSDQQRPMLKGEISGEFEIGTRHQQYAAVLDNGRKQLAEGRHDAALAAFGDALKLAPRSVDARLERAKTALEVSDTERALTDCEDALRIQPGLIDALVLRAQAYKAETRYALALAMCEEALRADPLCAAAILERGFIDWNRGENESALKDALAAQEIEPKSPRAAFLRASVLRDIGDERAAAAAARSALAVLDPKTPRDLMYRAGLTVLANKNDDKRAVADLDAAIARNPRDCDLVSERGAIHYNHDRFEAARDDFQRAIELLPRDAISYSNLGYACMALNDLDRSLNAFSKALELLPSHVLALSGRGQVHIRKGDYDHALADFSRVVELQPGEAAGHNLMGNVYSWKNDNERAIAEFTKAIEIDPNLVDGYNGLGNCYHKLGDFDRALKYHNRAIELDPGNAMLYVARGHTRAWKDDEAGALADAERALKINPTLADVYNLRGNIHYTKSRYAEAAADYGRALELNPDDLDFRNNHGNCYYYLNDLDRALADYEKVIAQNPSYADALVGRGKVRVRQGGSGWDADFQKARKLGADDEAFAAVEHRGLVFIRNRTTSATAYSYRWKLWDGTFSVWSEDVVEAGQTRYLTHQGGTLAQIRFDGKVGNNSYDNTVMDVDIKQIDNATDPTTLSEPAYAFRIEGSKQLLESAK